MSTKFNADEVFEIAVQIERNGSAFYQRAADIVKDQQERDLMLRLSGWEDAHEALFRSMRAELNAREAESLVFDPDGEASLYLRALADREVFDMRADVAATLTGSESASELLRTAIQREKDAVIFYLGMRDFVPESFGKDRIDGIIKEEMKHVSLLSNELTSRRP